MFKFVQRHIYIYLTRYSIPYLNTSIGKTIYNWFVLWVVKHGEDDSVLCYNDEYH